MVLVNVEGVTTVTLEVGATATVALRQGAIAKVDFGGGELL